MGRTFARNAIVTLALTGAVAAAAPATPAAAAPGMIPIGLASKIVLERSGGFAGEQTAFVVDRSTAGGRPALRMAGSVRFLRLRPAYEPKNPCCDRYAYRITVTYRTGFHKSVSTVQGTKAPRILWDTIGQAERYGVRPLAPR
ncbi:protealysin inhibitor emfourin [Dactylosporangium sp. NPDC000244]|uniref:protealysin inhibitor emfourin n=1 Tax=Dactylosporangium sp. NPDC000244 TaxID=3154365 RepID=UPI003332E137